MIISPDTMRHRYALSTTKPVSTPVVLCWASFTGMPVRSQRIARNGEMEQEVCQT
ncbi:hypothetical protein [Pseudohongiella sp.]|uniref:Uncharacterized protein n=1 Tax=marine sediment metagenome TaxID=412755 RepID=A0A0F9WGG1_9ZZZZ|nr:hypothetical protein [Pseudohongiella sp.]